MSSLTSEHLFSTTEPPKDLAAQENRMNTFIARHISCGTRIVCVTSGGTTVPLEKNTVRFIDNFSSGQRGAASVEHFLARGYSVIFLTRTGSGVPFLRRLKPSLDNISTLDLFGIDESGSIRVKDDHAEFAKALQAYSQVKEEDRLLTVGFVSVTDYLFYLRAVAIRLQAAGKSAMFYLAAAVSDFFVPETEMATHKIQSSEGPLTLHLTEVPKTLQRIRAEWAPDVYCVSFKLETDVAILKKKATGAIAKYGVHLVVGNELQSRYKKVVLYTAETETEIIRDDSVPDVSPFDNEIEVNLCDAVMQRHTSFIQH